MSVPREHDEMEQDNALEDDIDEGVETDQSGHVPRGGKRVALLIAVIVVVLLSSVGTMFAARWGPFAPADITVNGTMTVPFQMTLGSLDGKEGDRCVAADGYDDIAAGTDVTIKDNDGHTVAVTNLGSGTLFAPVDTDGSIYSMLCSFPFTTTIKHARSDFYSIKMGRESRGEVEYPVAKLGQQVSMSIG